MCLALLGMGRIYIGAEPAASAVGSGSRILSEANQIVSSSNAWISLFGFLISLFGLWLTYRQAKDASDRAAEAKSAAQDAKAAADAAAKKVLGFDASVSIYTAVDSLHKVSDLIVSEDWGGAVEVSVDVRKILERALNAHVNALKDNQQISALASYLDVLINNLHEKSHNATVVLNIAEVQTALVSHIVALAGLCELLRYQEGKN